jgi:hypothetical protein
MSSIERPNVSDETDNQTRFTEKRKLHRRPSRCGDERKVVREICTMTALVAIAGLLS